MKRKDERVWICKQGFTNVGGEAGEVPLLQDE